MIMKLVSEKWLRDSLVVAILCFEGLCANPCRAQSSPSTTSSVVEKAKPDLPRNPVLYDGFEGTSIESFWLPGNYGSGLYVPGAIQQSALYARSGTHSVEITVHEGDIAAEGSGNTQVERAELDSGHFPLSGKEAWYGFSILVPSNFPIVDTRLVLSSCKQSDVVRPLTAQRFRNGKHTLTIEAKGKKKQYRLPKLPLGQWVDFVCHARYAPGDDGRFELWMDGRSVATYSGPLAEPAFKNAFYHKIGLYRDRMKEPMRAYFDNYAMGTNYSSVDPTRFESNLKPREIQH